MKFGGQHTLLPQVGRDYKSAKAALADYHAGKDFILTSYNLPNLPINKSQCEAEGMTITIRYNKQRNAVAVT